MIHFIHDWRIEKRAGNFEYRECKTCLKRSIKVVDNLPRQFGGTKQYQWLEGKPLFTKDDRAIQFPNNKVMRDYMRSKNIK